MSIKKNIVALLEANEEIDSTLKYEIIDAGDNWLLGKYVKDNRAIYAYAPTADGNYVVHTDLLSRVNKAYTLIFKEAIEWNEILITSHNESDGHYDELSTSIKVYMNVKIELNEVIGDSIDKVPMGLMEHYKTTVIDTLKDKLLVKDDCIKISITQEK